MVSMTGGFRNTQEARDRYVLTIGQGQARVDRPVVPVVPGENLDTEAEVANHRELSEAGLFTGMTSQLTRIALAAKGSLTSIRFLGQNYCYYPKSKLDGGKKCEHGQYFAISSRQGIRSLSRGSRGHPETSHGIGLTKRSCKPEPLV
jgi:hypothetical protein